MTKIRTGVYTTAFADQHATSVADALPATAAAAQAGDWKAAATMAERLRDAGLHLHYSVVRDVLSDGGDWWTIGELVGMAPQAAFETYANLADSTFSPAQQRPGLAVVCTAGSAASHDLDPEFGIDLDDLAPGHSLNLDPTVVRIRTAAGLLGDDIWIAVTTPGPYEGDDELIEGTAILRWTTVVDHPDELGWLREALTLNAADDQDEDDVFGDEDPIDEEPPR